MSGQNDEDLKRSEILCMVFAHLGTIWEEFVSAAKLALPLSSVYRKLSAKV